MQDFTRMVDFEHQRPCDQWWQGLKVIAHLMAKSAPGE
jgi:hypothetical protein